MLLSVLFSLTLQAQAYTTGPSIPSQNPSPFAACVQTCQAWHEKPGYGLMSCLNECQRMYLDKPTAMGLNSILGWNNEDMPPEDTGDGSGWCETYEPGCSRPGNGAP